MMPPSLHFAYSLARSIRWYHFSSSVLHQNAPDALDTSCSSPLASDACRSKCAARDVSILQFYWSLIFNLYQKNVLHLSSVVTIMSVDLFAFFSFFLFFVHVSLIFLVFCTCFSIFFCFLYMFLYIFLSSHQLWLIVIFLNHIFLRWKLPSLISFCVREKYISFCGVVTSSRNWKCVQVCFRNLQSSKINLGRIPWESWIISCSLLQWHHPVD